MHALVRHVVMAVGLAALASAVWPPLAATAQTEPPDAIAAMLENARHDLEINTALEARISVEMERLRQAAHAPSDVITDYEAYLGRVRAMVTENRRLVQRLNALHLQSTLSKSSRQVMEAESLQTIIDTPIPEAGVVDGVAHLDRELDASLGEFDEMLLEELRLIREKSSPQMDSLAQEAADAAERLRAKGIDLDADPSETESEAEAPRQQTGSELESEPSPTGTTAGAAVRKDNSGLPTPSTGHAAEGVEGDRQRRAGRYDGSDDDIVARQLREAAEQETDPALKEKLWQEYETYKRDGE